MRQFLLETALFVFFILPFSAALGAGVWYAFGPTWQGLALVTVLMGALGLLTMAAIDPRNR